MILLLFGEEVFLGFGWLLWVLVAVRGRDTPPAPLKRGDLDTAFCLEMSDLCVLVSPLERGSRGVLWRGARDGWRCFCHCLEMWCFLASGGCLGF